MYKNKLSGEYITDDIIISETSEGITYFNGDTWVYVNAENIEPITSANETIIKYVDEAGNVLSSNVIESTDDTLEIENEFAYYFGITSITATNKKYLPTCAFISDPVSVSGRRKIALEADFTEGDNGSIEFSIIEGTTETPIIPKGVKTIHNEKLFFDIPLRFEGKDCKLYKNFKYTGASVKTADFTLDDVYTVDYTPTNGFEYQPKKGEVKIKAIMRMYTPDGIPPQINQLKIVEV